VPGYGQTQPSSEQYWFKPNRRNFLHARIRHDSPSGWFDHLELHLARQVITDNRLTQDFGSAGVTRESSESQLDGATLQFNSPWGPGDVHELTWGFEYYTDEIRSRRLVTDEPGGASQPARGRFPDRSTMDSAAVYGYNRWQWSRFAFSAGLRYSAFEIFLPADEEIGAARLQPSDLTGDLHLNFEARPGLHLVANLGRGFRPPNIFDLGTLGSRPGNRFNVPNPDLDPESVWSYDVGVKASNRRWQLEIYAWYADYHDKISPRFTGETTPEGRLVVQSDNLNSATLYGIESGLRFLAGDHLEWYAVVNYTRGTEQEQGTSVPADRVPPLNGRLGLVYRPLDRLRLETYLDFASRQNRLSPRDAEDPRINPKGTPGWGTLNLLLGWQLRPALELGLRLQNFGDKGYREHGSGIDAAGRNLGVWFDFSF
jgi:outer membrane receptor protein involved in Fe transport